MLSLNDDFLNVVTTTFKKTSFGDVFLKDVTANAISTLTAAYAVAAPPSVALLLPLPRRRPRSAAALMPPPPLP